MSTPSPATRTRRLTTSTIRSCTGSTWPTPGCGCQMARRQRGDRPAYGRRRCCRCRRSPLHRPGAPGVRWLRSGAFLSEASGMRTPAREAQAMTDAVRVAPTEMRFVATEEKGEVSALLMRPGNAGALLVLGHGAGTNMRHAFLEDLS